MRWASLFMLGMQVSRVSAIATIEAVGAKFFNSSSGEQFYIKGVAYQLTDDDPLVDEDQCKLDAALMQELGANTIRVYHVDPDGDHDGCMSAFADVGIYLFVDLETFDTSISQTDPYWDSTLLDAYEKVLDTFQGYDNLAGVFVGNEVLTTTNGSWAAPYVKAAARDVKAYRDSKGYRQIPVGYAAADIADLRPMLQDYMACSTNSSDDLDFFSLNAYEWCGDNTYEGSGYSELEKNATGYSIPIFFSETGCNTSPPRTFEDQSAIFGDDMADTWSGAIIYEWIQEANDYGLISYGPEVSATATGSNIEDGYTRKGTPTPVSPDFSNLKSVWATLSPTGVALSDYTASTSTITPLSCPAETPGVWNVDPSSALPTLGQTASASGTSTATGSGSSGSSSGSSSSSTATSSKGAAARGLATPGSGLLGSTSAVVVYSALVGFTGFMALWL